MIGERKAKRFHCCLTGIDFVTAEFRAKEAPAKEYIFISCDIYSLRRTQQKKGKEGFGKLINTDHKNQRNQRERI